MSTPKKTKESLFELLDDLNISHNTITHRPAFTVEDSKDVVKDIAGGHTKNLFLKTDKEQYILAVMLQDQRLDINSLRKFLKVKKLSFAAADKLFEILGVAAGHATPFAVINESSNVVKLYLDEEMMKRELLNFHPLRNDMSTTILSRDLIKFLNHLKADFSVILLPKL